ncbi:hypothetical protein Acr_18g0004320 [Actinidia rufa]|uniref:Uncharacterized protein n=1 Tax=Actinidia rufa TaxID=165716 RepID=A0A7J0G6A3_9ERIC|nr:hypothetical protein Acr_18g0004320 [Actinidia rufa]
MNALTSPCKYNYKSTFLLNHTNSKPIVAPNKPMAVKRKVFVRASGSEGDQRRRSFFSLEEAGLVEISGLSTHERFLCRLTVHIITASTVISEQEGCPMEELNAGKISSLNLLRVISEQEGCSMEELNAGKVCDLFMKDKLRRELNLDSAVHQWDDSDFQL